MHPFPAKPAAFPVLWLLSILLLPSMEATAADLPSDPFATARQIRPGEAGDLPCTPKGRGPLSLAEVVDQALCANPLTREAWANARYQAAQFGLARSAWLPGVGGTVTSSRLHSSGGGGIPASASQNSLALSASWLLWDFGGREAGVENAAQLLAAANFTQDATVQTVFLSAVTAWGQWFAAEGAVAAARESERASLESLKAAERRYEVGTATPADKLQARTAWSQSVLTRIKAEGDARSARGVLMNALGLDASDPLPIATPGDFHPAGHFEADLARLIDRAKALRPDLAAAEAQVRAARAGVDQVRASGLPSISLGGSASNTHSGVLDPARSQSIGVTVTIPLFTGFATTYRERAAREQLAAKESQRDRIDRQVSLDVWKAYHGLVTATESLRASADLLASAEQSRRVAKGRFDAGVGGILDLLNAESALANARQQSVQSRFDWLIARFVLAQSIGVMSLADLQHPESLPALSAEPR